MTQIFLDCDGVLADFDKKAIEVLGMHPRAFEKVHSDKLFWERLYSTPDFFTHLDPLPDAADLVVNVEWLCAYYKLAPPVILTGKPQGGWADAQKLAWRDKHFPWLEMRCVQSKNKRDHAKAGDIIIDDWERHQKRWEEIGGIWILHKNAKQSLQELQQHLENIYGDQS